MAARRTQGRARRASAGIAHAVGLLALLLSPTLLAQSYPNPLNNTATVTAPADVGDPTPGNNTATDTNALALQAQLSVTKTLLSASPVAAGGAVQYRIQVSNAGPSAAQGVAELMVAGGIRAIWNFTQTHVQVADDVIVENVDLAASLAVLSTRLAEGDKARLEGHAAEGDGDLGPAGKAPAG